MRSNLWHELSAISHEIEREHRNIGELAESAAFILPQLQGKLGRPIVLVDYAELHRYLYPQWSHFVRKGFWWDSHKCLRTLLIFFENCKYHKVLLLDYYHEFMDRYERLPGVPHRRVETVDLARLEAQIDECLVDIDSQLATLQTSDAQDKLARAKRDLLEALKSIDHFVEMVILRRDALYYHKYAVDRLKWLREQRKLINLADVFRDFLKGKTEFAIPDRDAFYNAAFELFAGERPDEPVDNRRDAAAVATAMHLQRLMGNQRYVIIFSSAGLMQKLNETKMTLFPSDAKLLKVIDIGFLAHAFSWFGRSGVTSASQIEVDIEYMEKWVDLKSRLVEIEIELKKVTSLGENRISEIMKEMTEADIERLIEEARVCKRDVAAHLSQLSKSGTLEAEIETQSDDLMRMLAGGGVAEDEEYRPLGNRVKLGISKVIEQVRVLDEKEVSAVRDLTSQIAGHITQLERRVRALVTAVRKTDEAIRLTAESVRTAVAEAESQESVGKECVDFVNLAKRAILDHTKKKELQNTLKKLRRLAPDAYGLYLASFYASFVSEDLYAARDFIRMARDLATVRRYHSPPMLMEAEAFLACKRLLWADSLRKLAGLPKPWTEPLLFATEATSLFEDARERWSKAGLASTERKKKTEFFRPTGKARWARNLTHSIAEGEKVAQEKGLELERLWLRNKLYYYTVYFPIGGRRDQLLEWIGELNAVRNRLEKKSLSPELAWFKSRDVAQVIDTIGFIYLRLAETSRKKDKKRLFSEAEGCFMQAFGIAGCPECSGHLAELRLRMARLHGSKSRRHPASK